MLLAISGVGVQKFPSRVVATCRTFGSLLDTSGIELSNKWRTRTGHTVIILSLKTSSAILDGIIEVLFESWWDGCRAIFKFDSGLTKY